MKRLLYFSFSVFLFFASACDSDLLKEDDKGGIDNDKFYSTIAGYNTLVTSSYASLRTIYGNDPILDLAGTDIYMEGRFSGGAMYIYQTLNDATNEVRTFYVRVYQAIQNTNAALFYIEHPPMKDDVKTMTKAEIRFLRAFYHFILIEQFGGIVINDEYTNYARVSIPRSTLSESYEFVIAEMEAALPDVPASSEPGRINKDVVNHYLAKVYLTRGWDLASNSDFEKAITYANAVIARKGAITLPYSQVWDPSNKNNAEFIFSVQFSLAGVIDASSTGNRQASNFSVFSGSGAGQVKRSGDSFLPAHNIVARYQENDNRFLFNFMLTTWLDYFSYYPSGKGTGTIQNYYPVIRDPNKTVITAEDHAEWDAYVNNKGGKHSSYVAFPIWAGNSPAHKTLYNQNGWANQDRRCPPFKKFDSPANPVFSTLDVNSSVQDVVLARLAETYFLKAEALIGLNRISDANDVVQLIIDRPGNRVNSEGENITNALIGVTDKQVALEAYLIETAKEMLGEYNGRWPILRRTKMLKYMLEKYNADLEKNNVTWHDRWWYRPIPEEAFDLNNALDYSKDQNPGY